jgi:hypothetical protein
MTNITLTRHHFTLALRSALRITLIVTSCVCLFVWLTIGSFRIDWQFGDGPFLLDRSKYIGFDADFSSDRFLGITLEERAGVAFERWLIVPAWMPLIPLLAGLAYLERKRYWERRRNARAEASLCERCGYDLRATPERCPECGTSVIAECRVPIAE